MLFITQHLAAYYYIWPPQLSLELFALTLKWLGHFFFSKCDFTFRYCSPYMQYFYMKLVQYNECLVSIVDTDGLVL